MGDRPTANPDVDVRSFFGRLTSIPSDGLPYPLFALSAILPWQLFAYALAQSSNSLIANDRIVSKVYFPRLVIPFSAVLAGALDFLIALAMLLVLMLYYGIYPASAVWSIPFCIVFSLGAALAVGLWLSALNVRYRDIRYTIPFITQFWLLASPVAYPSSVVPESWRWLYGLNPMVGAIEGFRWGLLGSGRSSGTALILSAMMVAFLFVGGLYYFRRMERTFADVI